MMKNHLTPLQRKALIGLRYWEGREVGVDASLLGVPVRVMRQLEGKGLVTCVDVAQSPCNSDRLRDADQGLVKATRARHFWRLKPEDKVEEDDKPVQSAAIATTAFLKWPGGKRRQIENLRRLTNPHRDRRLVDLFCGPGGVSLGLEWQNVLAADVNPYLVNCLQWVQREHGFRQSLAVWAYDPDVYESQRAQFNTLNRNSGQWTEDAAQLMYYLNRTCFNGVFRLNSAGAFNVSFGRYKTVNFLSPEAGDFEPWKRAFAHWDIRCQDFRETLQQASDDDLIYADPPFDSVKTEPDGTEIIQTNLFGDATWLKSGTGFTGYSAEGFSATDQLELAQMLADRRGPTILQNRATPRIVALYEKLGFDLEFVMAARHVNCDAKDRTPVREVIAKKNL